ARPADTARERRSPARSTSSRGDPRSQSFPLFPDERIVLAGEPASALGVTSSRRREAQKSPCRRGADERGRIVEASSYGGYELRIARRGVAECDQHVADKPVASGALDRGARKHGAERPIVD